MVYMKKLTVFLMHRLLRALISSALVTMSTVGANAESRVEILNVSYDVTREFYKEFNDAFAKNWAQKNGSTIVINQSHGGSSKQARSVIDGLAADVVTMNQPLDIDILHERGNLIPENWASRLPNHSVPYYSTVLFIVRKGNPKKIHDWDDLVRPGVSVIIPNPKTSGNGRYSYLGAWGHAIRKTGRDEAAARAFVARLFGNVPVLDTGGRGATTTFAQREIGDVLLTFESEAALVFKEFKDAQLEVVVPTESILAENPVVWVDSVVSKRGTLAEAKAYLEYLYSDEGQELAAKYNFRPSNKAILDKHAAQFRPLELFTVEEVAGSWSKANQAHFLDGGVFDNIYGDKRR